MFGIIKVDEMEGGLAMLANEIMNKLTTLADAAKYDVSCASSGVDRKGGKGLGNAAACGICHTWSSDGRCVSLLKLLLSNDCVFDCAYCINRSSNDIRRESFTAEEIATLTMEFYRRNYIEGLFLSSAIEKNPDHTMEKILKVLMLLRKKEKFFGYIHVKAIPGADPILIKQAGMFADRMSINIELPSTPSLKLLAPQKKPEKLFLPMKQIADGIMDARDGNRHAVNKVSFVPAGQSTQMVIGASPDSDRTILQMSQQLYNRFNMKRVYYSAYMAVNDSKLLPAINTAPPMLREHRLYQADWLLRFYHFDAGEILEGPDQNLDLTYDPKISWAFRHMDRFPMEINKASYEELLRVPGIGMVSARRIVKQRHLLAVSFDDLKKMGVVVKRARYFVTCQGRFAGDAAMSEDAIKHALNPVPPYEQMSLFN